jgi:leucine dehydrogenase
MIEDSLKKWDGETVLIRYDRPTGAWIIIAIHSTRLGPAVGGTRMKTYPDLEAALLDALRLSSGMTYKFAVPEIPFGGGKAVIAVPADLSPESRSGLLKRHGALIHQLGGLYYTGPDVGISSADMDIIGETGSPYVFSRTPAAGGAGSPGPYTALGVFTGILAACQNLFGKESVKGKRVLVQGTGSVGEALIDLLLGAGAVVTFSEVNDNVIRHFRDESGLQFVPPDDIYTAECDIFSPCALGGVLNADTIPKLRCGAVAGGANNQLAGPEDPGRLKDRDILYAPDYVINIGGAMAILGLETKNWTPERARKEVVNSVRRALRKVFELAEADNMTTEAAARQIAEDHLSRKRARHPDSNGK